VCVHASHKQQISSHDGGTTTASVLHTGQLSGTRFRKDFLSHPQAGLVSCTRLLEYKV
jgi:hypothetical protein